MVRPWVKVSLFQYEKSKEIRKKSGRPLSKIIREAVVIAKRTCQFDEIAILHIILIAEDLDFIFLRLYSRSKLCLAWW